MAIANFIPEIWAARAITTLRKSLVFAAPDVVNRDYQGEISRAGDTVHITGLADATIGTYTKHTDITIEDVDDSDTPLVIDQSKYFAFEVDDIENVQAAGDILNTHADQAAYKLRDVADQFVATTMAAGIDAGNVIAESTLTLPEEAYDLLVDLGVVLDEDNVPDEGRWSIVTPAFYGLLLKDPRFISTGDPAAASTRANGVVGSAAGFTIRKSNNAPDGPGVGAGKLVIAGSKIAATYAEQINKVEQGRMEKRFADFVKGLHLYGSEVIRPTALAAADVIV